jgi:hypothetical protein
MPKSPSAAKPDLASAMYPALSQKRKVEEARRVQAEAEQKARSRRTADNLQAVLESLRRERGR